MQKTKWIKALMVTGALASMFSVASAHVVVTPKVSTAGIEEKYTMRVPSEKNSNTVKVRMEFPAGEEVDTVEPMPGWSYTYEKNSNGDAIALDWTATNGGIKPNEFAEFSFIGGNPKKPTTLAWKVYQTYADGSTVEWTGAPDSDTPASVTTIESANAPSGTQPTQQPAPQQTTAPAATNTSSSNNTVPYILSGVAILLSLVSLFRKRA